MRDIVGAANYADVIDAPSPEDPKVIVRLGVRVSTFQQYKARGLATAIAQYYGLVQEGMWWSKHLFEGLNRPLMLADDMDADRPVLVYTWRSPVDFEWHGATHDGYPIKMVPLAGRVFAVLVRRQEPSPEGIVGSVVKWNWIKEDPRLPDAPVGWEQRYGRKVWSR
jgi:hypothetical protein